MLQKNKVIYSCYLHFITGLADRPGNSVQRSLSTMYSSLTVRHITTVEEDKLYFFFTLDVTEVSTISSFNIIIFHANKEDSAFNCLLPSMGHGDVCINLTDPTLKGICFKIFALSCLKKMSKRNIICTTYAMKKFLAATLKKKSDDTNFSNAFYLN